MRDLFDYTGSREQSEIMGDLFAGGGGASAGIRMALGRDPDFAINHNPLAVAMHEANHPDTVHFTEDVWSVTPSRATQGRPLGLLWASPDCTHFSKAKGGAPHRDERIRSLAMVLTDKWIPEARPRVIIMENVEEFRTWCDLIPLMDKKTGKPVIDAKTGKRVMVPDKTKIDENGLGNLYKAWLRKFRRHGYSVQDKELRACDYGAPTIRKRLFIIARRDGQPIVWPEPTHGDPESEAVKSGRLLPWRTAAECIDWDHPCPSIFDTAEEIYEKYGVRAKRPLAEKTLRRIAEGIKRYVLKTQKPFIVKTNHTASYYNCFRGHGIDEPLQTVTKEPGFSLVAPHLTEHANSSRQRNFDAGEPLRTQCAQVKGGHFALVSPLLEAHYGGQGSRALRLPDIKEPFRTVSTENRFGLVSPTLIQTGYGEREGQAPRVPGVDNPLGTVVAGGVKHAVVSAFLAKHFGGVVGADARNPMPTVTTVDHNSVVAAHIERQFGRSAGNDVQAPAGSVTAGGSGKSALVASNMIKYKGTATAYGTDEPVHSVLAGGLHHAEVRAFLMKYYSEGGQDQPCADPMHTLTTKARMGLVTVNGEDYVITDIGMRMLQPRELYRAQGFPESYIIDTVRINGKRKPLTKTNQVKMCGNSVPPPMVKALVLANVELRIAEEVAA